MSDIKFDGQFDEYVSFQADFGVVTSTAAVVDPTVTEDSPNPVASSGIYTFVKDEVSAEKTSRDAAIFAESQERMKGDEDIQRYVTSKIEAEESSRSSADTDLANSISELSRNTVKTVNHIAPDAEGNVNVEAGGSGLVDDVKVNGVSVVTDKVANVAVPTKVSSLENDAGYISQIPQIPTKLSQMTNDVDFTTKGYVDEEISKIPAPPTKTSQLTNDSGYITSADVPAPYDDTEIREEISGLDDKIKDLELFKFPNVTIIGTPTINNGQISDFSATSYLKFPFLVDFRSQPFEINMAFTTGSNVVNQENIFDSDYGLAFAIRNSRFVIAISTNGTSWNLGEGVGSLTVQPNTTYYIKIAWNGSQYILYYSFDGVSYIPDITKAGTAQPYPKQIYIGVGENFASVVNHFGGTINLNNANLKVNGEVFWSGMDDAGISTRADVSLSNIDADGEAKIKEVAETDSIKDSLNNKIEDSALTPLRDNISTLTSQMANKQDKLVSGTNIKTINGNTLLGSGDITIGGGSGTVKTVNNIGPDASGNVAIPLGRIDDPVGRTEYANNYKLTGDGKCAGNNNYQLWKWAVVEGAEYKIETTGFWQFQNTNSVSTSSTAALIGEVQTGSQDKVIVPAGASWLILEVPKTETSIVYRILRESSAGGEAVNKAYVDQQNALQDAEITSVKADLSELDTKFNELVGTSKPANLLIPSDFLHGKSLQFTANVSTPNDIIDSASTTVINLIETEGDDWYETNCPSGSIFLGYTWYNGDYRRSQFISSFEVEGDHYKFKMLPNMTRLRGFVYNNSVADFDSLRITKYGEWDKQGGTVLLPEGCVTLNNLDDELKSYIAPTTLANKKICGIGDSIMIGVGDGAGGFLDILKDYEENVTVVNLGVGSTTIQFNNNVPSNVTGKCILDRIDDIPEDTDIIILEGGLNDYYHQEQYGTTLGTYEEYLHQYPLSARYENGAYVNLPYVGQSGVLLNNNFCNAFEMCLTKVLVRFIGKPFIYVIPHNPVGSADIDLYFDTAKILCKKYGVPCLDIREIGCMPRINILCGREGTSRFTVDNVHPSKLGYKTHYAPLIYNFLKSIIV